MIQGQDKVDYIGFEQTQPQLLASTQSSSVPVDDDDGFNKQTLATYAFETTFQPSAWYECLQELDCEEYSNNQIFQLKQLFEANQEQLEKFKQLQAAQLKSTQNVARRTVKVQPSTTAVNQ